MAYWHDKIRHDENKAWKLFEVHNSLTKLMVSRDLLRSVVTNQIAFDQRDLHLTPDFECVIDHCCQALVSKLKTLDTITFT